MRIVEAVTRQDIAAAKTLCLEYATGLDFDLCFQGFEAEMVAFPDRYAPPTGALLLACRKGAAAGSVALRGIGGGICEMKRLYVRPAARGRGIGGALARRIVTTGRALGYHAMRLDTVAGLQDAALTLYRRIGFREIAPYCPNPIPGAVYLELALWPPPWSPPSPPVDRCH